MGLELEWACYPHELGTLVNRLKSIAKRVRVARVDPDGEHRPIVLVTITGKLVEEEGEAGLEVNVEQKLVLSDQEHYVEGLTMTVPMRARGYFHHPLL